MPMKMFALTGENRFSVLLEFILYKLITFQYSFNVHAS